MGCGGSKAAAVQHDGDSDNHNATARTVDTDTFATILTENSQQLQPQQQQTGGDIPTTSANNDNIKMQKKIKCDICFVKSKPGLTPLCSYGCHACGDCVKAMFVKACFDMSLMPPRCCMPINLGVGAPFLSKEELELFKARIEEARTVEPVYCPVPTCSAFIPYRLFPKDKQPSRSRPDGGKEAQNNNNTRRTAPVDTSTDNPSPQSPAASKELSHQTGVESPNIPCHRCGVRICCDCKLLAHPGSACTSKHNDIDDDLAKILRSFKIRRCPKCRTGVRRMFGCSEMLCRCGCQWCWRCGRTIDECHNVDCVAEPNGCGDDVSDDDGDDDNDEDEDRGDEEERPDGNQHGNGADAPSEAHEKPRDLDAGGREVWDSGQEFNFGGEVDYDREDQSHCFHRWLLKTHEAPGNHRDRDYWCEQCWRTVVPQLIPFPEIPGLMEVGHISPEYVSQAMDEGFSATKHEALASSPETDTVKGYYFCQDCHWLLCIDCFYELS